MSAVIGFVLEAAINSLSFLPLKTTRWIVGSFFAALIGWGVVSLF